MGSDQFGCFAHLVSAIKAKASNNFNLQSFKKECGQKSWADTTDKKFNAPINRNAQAYMFVGIALGALVAILLNF